MGIFLPISLLSFKRSRMQVIDDVRFCVFGSRTITFLDCQAQEIFIQWYSVGLLTREAPHLNASLKKCEVLPHI